MLLDHLLLLKVAGQIYGNFVLPPLPLRPQ